MVFKKILLFFKNHSLNFPTIGPVMDDGDGRLRVDARAHTDPGTNMDVVADNGR
jgi:hypothetical protein